MNTAKRASRCYLYVLNTLADWEIGHITAELKSGRYMRPDRTLELVTIGNTRDAVKTMGGFSITPDMTVEEAGFREGDVLILPGGDTWAEKDNGRVLDLLPALLEKKILVAAICGATAALAERGILDKRRHTSNDKEFLKMFCPGYRGSEHYVETAVAVDDNLITASGLAPLEFSYEIFRKTNVMKTDTLEAWYGLFRTREPQYFYSLMESLR